MANVKMLLVFVSAALLGLARGAPAGGGAEIIEYTNVVNPDGSYDFSFVQSDGTRRTEHGEQLPGEEGGMSVSGFYSYIGPDGVEYRVDYVSNEGGFQPQGEHLPSGAGSGGAGPAQAPQSGRGRIAPAALASLVG